MGITRSEFGCDWPLVEISGAMVVALFAVVVLLLVFYKFRGELKLLLYIKFGWRPLDRKDDRIHGKVSMYLFQESIFSFVVIKVDHSPVAKEMVWSQALQCDSWFGSLSMTWRQFTHSMILLSFGSRKYLWWRLRSRIGEMLLIFHWKHHNIMMSTVSFMTTPVDAKTTGLGATQETAKWSTWFSFWSCPPLFVGCNYSNPVKLLKPALKYRHGWLHPTPVRWCD